MNSSPNDPIGWFETLRDFYSIACPFVKDKDKAEEKIRYIKRLIYGKVTHHQKEQNMEIAYEKIRELFEEIHRSVYQSGIYMPIYSKRNPGESILQMED